MKWLTAGTFRRDEQKVQLDLADFCCGQGRLFEQSLHASAADPPSILIVDTGCHGILVEFALVKVCESGAAAALLNSVEKFYRFFGLQHGGARVGIYAAWTALRHRRVGRMGL